ncbi:VIT1/CCC1 transporter family protein [Sulfolobus acidocaldarius]|uniref:Conserved protein n=4 Tax=Sulfolobus acidocaldarius TaxID=2285 RepID=Q4J8C6_SULAC|nr:VIT1/CCC1 transporter family protein [Sulfolobus acidocaldarius]AAY80956.1 conserved protein [Sulfolobus acidocaldarius DSM 639]AGE71557.1 hypothetical protein SacN8_07985 [Sulfolobus acidocaldarius N8]AGE73830.1 hypothetical protein SacRon12I_07995 [Sulfolobus acidocaldarius Ron12/I]ALU30216.1 rubrerythrin family protein [Sulfolobus acidocaldarius]ALU30931.1 rubrerythrin family protein [Sulfolobus acidocaldarius]
MSSNPSKNYKDELFDREVYRELAKDEKDNYARECLLKLAEMEEKHAEVWRKIADRKGLGLEQLGKIDRLRIKFYKTFRKIFGLQLTIKLLESRENESINKYLSLARTEEFTQQERQKIREIAIDEAVHEELLGRLKAKDVGDFIYGISDGLVEVLAATSGIAGAIGNPLFVAVSGLIVGASGTLSMSIGAYLSTKSSKEINQIKRKRIEEAKAIDKNEVMDRLSEVLVDMGVKEEVAEKLSPRLVDVAEDIISPETDESPRKSALITGLSYIVGAIIPVITYLIGLSGLTGLISSYLVSGLAIFTVGSLIGLISEVNPVKKGAEMLVLGIGAAIATHLLGVLAAHFLPPGILPS